jgi:hypothetical protein
MLEQSADNRLAEEAYESLAALINESENEAFAETVRLMDGALRRMRLLGKEMGLSGTTLDGAEFDWKSYRDKVVLVHFGDPHSSLFEADVRKIKENYDLYRNRGFDVVGICTSPDREALEKLIERGQLPWVFLHEADSEARHPMATHYGVTVSSVAILVGQDGRVASLQARGNVLDQLLEELLGTAYAPVGKLAYVDLESKANKRLTEGVPANRDNNLGELPTGEQTFGGVPFIIGDAYIQLGSRRLPSRPTTVEGIPIRKKFSTLYVLHATLSANKSNDGAVVGRYNVQYEDGSTAAIPIVLGEDVRGLWDNEDPKPTPRGRIVWRGSNAASRRRNRSIRLYLSAWTNPRPDREVVQVDFISTNTDVAPFCVAMTVEEPTSSADDMADSVTTPK